MQSDVSRTNGAPPSNGGVLPAPRLSDPVENALSMMNIPADLVESLRQLPQDKRAEVEKHLIPALETVTWIVVTKAAPSDVDYSAIRDRYPVDIAESLITGIENCTKNTCKGDTQNAK